MLIMVNDNPEHESVSLLRLSREQFSACLEVIREGCKYPNDYVASVMASLVRSVTWGHDKISGTYNVVYSTWEEVFIITWLLGLVTAKGGDACDRDAEKQLLEALEAAVDSALRTRPALGNCSG